MVVAMMTRMGCGKMMSMATTRFERLGALMGCGSGMPDYVTEDDYPDMLEEAGLPADYQLNEFVCGRLDAMTRADGVELLVRIREEEEVEDGD